MKRKGVDKFVLLQMCTKKIGSKNYYYLISLANAGLVKLTVCYLNNNTYSFDSYKILDNSLTIN